VAWFSKAMQSYVLLMNPANFRTIFFDELRNPLFIILKLTILFRQKNRDLSYYPPQGKTIWNEFAQFMDFL